MCCVSQHSKKRNAFERAEEELQRDEREIAREEAAEAREARANGVFVCALNVHTKAALGGYQYLRTRMRPSVGFASRQTQAS